MRKSSAVFAALLVLAAAVPCFAIIDGRLEANVVPSEQRVELHLDANARAYTGSVWIDVEVVRETDVVEFHAEEMTITRAVMLRGDTETPLECELIENGFARGKAASSLATGTYRLEIDFEKEYNNQAHGLYKVLQDGQGYLFTQFQDVDARKAFPCWDEPIYKIPYQLTIHIPEGQTVVSNTPADVTASDGVQTFAFAKTPPLPSYLLAIAAGPLESVEITGLSVPGRVYFVKGKAGLAEAAVEVTPPILAALEEYFDRPYPYKKLDLIAVPDFWPGAMENVGAVTYREDILLLEPGNASVSQQRQLARVTAHELAHMWFGDLVTMSWWDDLWLNESFADWLGDKITIKLFPEYDLDLAELRSVQGTMRGDARPSSTPIRKKVVTSEDIMEDVGLAYNKGKTVLAMVERWIGEESFRRGVIDYINEHAWGSTVASDLFAALSTAADTDISVVMSSFLDQPGYPLIEAALSENGVVTLTQKRFVNHGVEADAQSWVVPVQLRYSDGQEVYARTVLMEDEQTTVELGSDVLWLHPNAGAYGYYAWKAPTHMMQMMAQNPDVLDDRERAVFLSNARSLLGAGDFRGDEFLELLTAVAQSPEPEAVTGVIDALGAVEGAFVTADLEDAFAVYIRQTLRPALDRIGMVGTEGEAEAVTVLRPRLLAWLGTEGHDMEVREHCLELAESYMEAPESIDPQTAGVALYTAAIDGDRALYETFQQKFESATVPAERRRYLRAIGSFRDPDLQLETMKYAFGGKVRLNEMFGAIGPIMQNPAGRDLVYTHMTSNYDAVAAKLPPMFKQYMPFIASGCSAERLEEAREFFGLPGHGGEAAAKTLAKVADQVMDCVNLREREGAAVAEYLDEIASVH